MGGRPPIGRTALHSPLERPRVFAANPGAEIPASTHNLCHGTNSTSSRESKGENYSGPHSSNVFWLSGLYVSDCSSYFLNVAAWLSAKRMLFPCMCMR